MFVTYKTIMKKLILNTLFIFTLLFNVAAQAPQNIGAIRFNQLLQTGNGVILDVRTPREFSRGHIDNATLISIADRAFVSKINLLQKDKPVYIYCLTGSRSRSAANYMAKNGFTQVFNLQRGILDWQRNNLPVVISDATVASNSISYTNDSFNQLIKSDNLVLIDFHAPWCAPCKTMSPVIKKLTNDFKGKAKIEKIDVEANRLIAEANQIQSIPGFILYKNGQSVWMHKGIISYDDLSKLLNSHL